MEELTQLLPAKNILYHIGGLIEALPQASTHCTEYNPLASTDIYSPLRHSSKSVGLLLRNCLAAYRLCIIDLPNTLEKLFFFFLLAIVTF
jgi:hypothetical protein